VFFLCVAAGAMPANAWSVRGTSRRRAPMSLGEESRRKFLCPLFGQRGGFPAMVSADADGATVDKGLSSDRIITYAGVSDEFKPLIRAALIRLDRNRVIQGKPKYETIDGMIDAYVEEADKAGLGWTREESESEVVRYLQRQALADEGGVDGDGQDKGAFALLALLIGLGTAQLGQATGIIEWPLAQQQWQSPFW